MNRKFRGIATILLFFMVTALLQGTFVGGSELDNNSYSDAMSQFQKPKDGNGTSDVILETDKSSLKELKEKDALSQDKPGVQDIEGGLHSLPKKPALGAEDISILATTIRFDEVESNDYVNVANIITNSFSADYDYNVFGYINYESDVDIYRFTLPTNGNLRSVGYWIGDYYNFNWEEDFWIGIFDANENLVAEHDLYWNSSNEEYRSLNINLSQGTYYMLVMTDPEWSSIYAGEPYVITLDYTPSAPTLHTVVFVSNGGTDVPIGYVYSNQLVPRPADPVKPGYLFAGWYSDPAFNIPWDFNTSRVVSNLTLWAKWDVVKSVVNFESNGGSYVSPVEVDYNGLLPRPADPMKSGSTFEGWYTDSALTIPWDFNYSRVTANMTLYAKWTANSYTVSFETSGGNYIPSQTILRNGIVLKPADPYKTGHTFGGWYSDANYTSPWDFNYATVTSDIVLYAKWNIIQFNVSFETFGGSTIYSNSIDYNGLVMKPMDPIKPGYLFGGWYKTSSFTVPWVFESDRVTADTVIYADWIDLSLMDLYAGNNRYATAVEISKKSFSSTDTVILALGTNFPDALAGGPLAITENAPILLTTPTSLRPETLYEILRLGASKVMILGSDGAISKAIDAELQSYGIIVERVYGDSRYGTAVEVAKKVRSKTTDHSKVILASGTTFADALAIGSYAAKEGIPILLTRPDVLTPTTKTALQEFAVDEVLIVGDVTALSSTVENEIRSMGILTSRVFGANRFNTSVSIAARYFSSSENAVFANGMVFADALAAAPFAARMNAPIILLRDSIVTAGVKEYLPLSTIGHAVFVGGDAAIKTAVKYEVVRMIR